MLDVLKQGGVTIIPLIIFSVISLAISIERFIYLKNAKTNNYNLINKVRVKLNDDKVKEATVMGKYESVISSLGVQGQRANQMVENQDTLVNQLENKRQSISGVSSDEEMANMIKYQQAYNAAAKLITKNDEMLDSLMAMVR